MEGSPTLGISRQIAIILAAAFSIQNLLKEAHFRVCYDVEVFYCLLRQDNGFTKLNRFFPELGRIRIQPFIR